ncbi:MAG: hypothetical protein IJP74_06785 [Prevotella sp.]|nr:hypothetical protein [Prevotella sp.]
MARVNKSENFDLSPEFCGQGVGVESSVSISGNGKAYVRTRIKDGTGKDIGNFVVIDDRDKAYLDLNDISKMKRRTLCNVLAIIKKQLEEALEEQLTAESDAPAAEAEDDQTGGGEGSGEGE